MKTNNPKSKPTSLAMNMNIPFMIKTKYYIGLAVLPMGLMFSAFGVLYLIMQVFGWTGTIPRSEIAVFLVVFIPSMVGLMLGGFWLGWQLNKLIARVVYGWSADKAYKAFNCSDVPVEWYKDPALAEMPAAVRQKNSAWATTRKQGKLSFVVKTGVCQWGGLMFLIMGLIPALRSEVGVQMLPLAMDALLWIVAGAIFGLLTWHLSERQFLKQQNDSEENNP